MTDLFDASTFLRKVDAYRPNRIKFQTARSLDALTVETNRLYVEMARFKIAKTIAQQAWLRGQPGGGRNHILASTVTRQSGKKAVCPIRMNWR